jgi:hypothetical protein
VPKLIKHYFLVAALAISALTTGCSNTPPNNTGAVEKTEASAEAHAPDHTSAEVIDAFVENGLEAKNPRSMTRSDYGAAPLLAAEGTRFQIPSLASDLDGDGHISNGEEDVGGRVMSFRSQNELLQTKAYYDDLAKASAAFFSHTFVKDNLLVQINGGLPDEKAAEYDRALQGVGK